MQPAVSNKVKCLIMTLTFIKQPLKCDFIISPDPIQRKLYLRFNYDLNTICATKIALVKIEKVFQT